MDPLSPANQRLREFVSAYPGPVAMFDRGMRYVAWSPLWVREYHLEGRELSGCCHYDLFPSLPERWREVHRRGLAGATQSCDLDTFQQEDGRVEHLRWVVQPWGHAPDGLPAGILILSELITERVETEQALRVSEARLRAAQAAARLGSWEVDHTTGRLWWSDETCNIYEVDPAAWSGSYEEWASYLHPEDRALVEAEVARCTSQGLRMELHHRLLLREGRVKHVHAIGETHLDAQGRPLRSVGTVQDVTAQRQVEETLRAERARLRTLLDTIPDLVWLKDPQGVFLSCNKRFEGLLGAPEAVIVGKTDHDFVPKELADFFREKDQRAIAAGAPCVNEEWLVYPDGHRELVQTIKTPMFEPDGRLVGVLGIARDLTAIRQAQSELEAAHGELRKLSLAVEQSPAMIMITDPRGRIEYVNPHFCEVTGYAPEEVLGRTPRILRSGETSQAVYDELWAAIGAGEDWRGEVINRRKSGESYPQSLAISPVRDAQGVVTHFVAFMEDVADARQREETLRETREQLLHAQKMEAVGRLAGGVAHDFNNLLTVIEGFTRMVHDEVRDPRLRDRLGLVLKASERASGLTRQLLAFSRKLPAQPLVLDPAENLQQLRSMLVRLIGENLTLQLELKPGAGDVRIDPGLLEQAIMNLVLNARDASPPNGTITVSVQPASLDPSHAAGLRPPVEPGEYVRLSVIDHGHGMDERVAARLFEPFFSTKEPGKGTGLGLATVYGIAQECGAGIAVTSAPQAGARFDVYLPRVASAGPDLPPREPTPPPLEGRETILLVEDDEGVRMLVGEVLASAGYAVLAERLPEQALELARAHEGTIDLLLSDVIMPQLTGPELARRLLEVRPGLKVLFMSGYPGDSLPLLPAGYLRKPLAPSALLAGVREALDRRPGAGASGIRGTGGYPREAVTGGRPLG